MFQIKTGLLQPQSTIANMDTRASPGQVTDWYYAVCLRIVAENKKGIKEEAK